MLPEKGSLVICLTIGLVILFNLVLVYSLTRPSTRSQLNLLGQTLKHLRNPWEKEERAMQELRSEVAKLEEGEGEGEGEHADE